MSNIKLVLADMDGTMMSYGSHEVSQRVRDSIIAAEKAGVTVVAVTGRPYEMAQEALLTLGISGPCVFDNGATIRQAETGELLWNNWLDVETARQLVAFLTPYSSWIDYEIEQNEHAPRLNEVDFVETPAPYVFAYIRPEDHPAIVDYLAGIPDISHYVAPALRAEGRGRVGIQINHARADKFHGVEALRRLVDVPKENSMAIGDGDNDVALFGNAGLRIAMGNATDTLKQVADHVVESVDDDGFAIAMDKFVLS